MSAPGVNELVPFVLLISTIGALVTARFAWQRREQPGAAWLALVELVAALWTGFDLFNYLAEFPSIEVLLKCSSWALILFVGFAFFRFTCIYTRRERWWELVRAPVVFLIVANLLVMVTNSYHHLLWPGVRWVDLGFARVPWLESGPAFFWIFRPTAYGLPLAGVIVLILGTAGSQTFYLRHIVLLTTSVVIPIAVNFFLNSPTTPNIDVTPVTVVLVVAAFALSTLHFGLLDVRPVARSLLLEQLDDGVVVLDAEERVVDLNPAAERLLRHEHRHAGMAAGEAMSFWDQVKTRLDGAESPAIEIDLANEAGTVVEVTCSSIRDESGDQFGRVIVLHDVTASVRLVRELDAYAETVARDLKSPLAEVVRSIEEVQQTNKRLSGESTEHLRAAERVCGRMTATVDALLCFAQLRTQDEIAVERLDMSKVVDAALQRLSAAIAASRAEIVVPEQWPVAVGHPIWVEEIWTNYISNAIKYGGSPPRVEVGASPDGAGARRFWVRDNGPGLNEQQRSRLFTEFTRLEPRRSEGHGLGLSIVQRIVEKLGGGVGCDSKPGEGSTFWFTLSA